MCSGAAPQWKNELLASVQRPQDYLDRKEKRKFLKAAAKTAPKKPLGFCRQQCSFSVDLNLLPPTCCRGHFFVVLVYSALPVL